MNIKQQFRAAMKAAEDIMAKADSESRQMTRAELDEMQKHLDEAERLKKHMAKAQQAADLFGGILDGDAPPTFSTSDDSDDFPVSVVTDEGAVVVAKASDFVEADEKDFRAAAAKRMTIAAAKSIHQRVSLATPGTLKKDALIGSTISVPGQFQTAIEGLPAEPTSILQLIDAEVRRPGVIDSGNTFSFLYEQAFDNNAASVPDTEEKPESEGTVEEVTDRYRVFAHRSEPYPERYLEDYPTILQLIQREFSRGVLEAVERAVLAGNEATNGTTGLDDFNGILNRSGLRTAAWQGSLLDTVAYASFVMDANHEEANAWVFNPADLHALTMLRENGSTGALLFGTGRTALSQFLGDAKIVTSSKMPAGTAVLGNWSKVKLMTLASGITLKIYQDAAMVENNTFKFRSEGRFGLKMLRPAAFVKVSLGEPEEP